MKLFTEFKLRPQSTVCNTAGKNWTKNEIDMPLASSNMSATSIGRGGCLRACSPVWSLILITNLLVTRNADVGGHVPTPGG